MLDKLKEKILDQYMSKKIDILKFGESLGIEKEEALELLEENKQ